MNIAIASGKGGTGKTTLSTNFAVSIARAGERACYLDCDVEEPNGRIFLKPEIEDKADVCVGVPEIDFDKCTGCGECDRLCQYSAIVCLNDKPLVFEELCHSCGGCMAICPEGAISEKPRKIGIAETGKSNDLYFADGNIDIGAIQSPALIRHVKKHLKSDAVNIIDAPPGTSCPVIEAVNGCDFILLVTEPTPFGLNDLALAVDMARELKIPFAVAINRSDLGDGIIIDYCRKENVDILIKIPNDRKIAENYSRGTMIVDALEEYQQKFQKLYEDIKSRGKR